MTNQPYYRELFLHYSHLLRMLRVVDQIEETLTALVENGALETELQWEDCERLAMIILHASLQSIAGRLTPPRPEDIAVSIHLQEVLKQCQIQQSSDVAAPVNIL